MSIIDLYKLHINSNPTGVELHNLFTSFDINSVVIKNPNPVISRIEEESRVYKVEACKKWILKNSKLKL